MEQALADLKAALEALNTKVNAIQPAAPPAPDHTADVQQAAAAVNSAVGILNTKFPS